MATKQCAFVYGTLMYKPVLETLLHRVPPTCKAEVKGFRRYAITTQVFPGTIESTADSTVRMISVCMHWYCMVNDESKVFNMDHL